MNSQRAQRDTKCKRGCDILSGDTYYPQRRGKKLCFGCGYKPKLDYFLSKVNNVAFVQLKIFGNEYMAHEIFLEYSQGSNNECKHATMLEF